MTLACNYTVLLTSNLLNGNAKVFQGICMARPDHYGWPQDCTAPQQVPTCVMQSLWIHEASRVFVDRLVSEHDKNWTSHVIDAITRYATCIRHSAMLPSILCYEQHET